MALVVEHGIRWHDRFIDLQSITLKKVGGESRSPAPFGRPSRFRGSKRERSRAKSGALPKACAGFARPEIPTQVFALTTQKPAKLRHATFRL